MIISLVGVILLITGTLTVVSGVAILGLSAIQLYRQMFGTIPKSIAAEINLPQITALIEAIVKIPQWLLALIAGDLQLGLGIFLLNPDWFQHILKGPGAG